VDKLRIEANESVLMRCGNYIGMVPKSGPSHIYHAVAVHFYPEVLLRIYDDRPPKFLKSQGKAEVGMYKLNSDVLIKKYIDSMLFYFDNPSLVNEDILALKLKEIVLLLYQTKNALAIQVILSNLFNPASYSFREIVESHYYSNITLEELAQLTNMSLSTFKREFRKIYGAPPASYIRKTKLRKALDLMGSTDLRATEIAYECGFNNISHFSKTFKQVFGASPTSYKMTHFGKSMG
jgi:AraC-like DNA-binding protein